MKPATQRWNCELGGTLVRVVVAVSARTTYQQLIFNLEAKKKKKVCHHVSG